MKTVFVAMMLCWLCLSAAGHAKDIVVKGSDTLGAKMVPQLAEAYKVMHPVNFEIAAEGSSTCFSNLLAGSCDFGMSSRPVKDSELEKFKEKGITLTEHVVAHDMIAVVVNAKNPINGLTRKQVEQVFTGDVMDWKPLGWEGKIYVYTRNTSSGTYKTFQKLAMSGREYGKFTQKIAGGEHIPSLIAKDHFAIGYTGLVSAMFDGIKPLAIDGVLPNAANVEKYPLTRNLYFYTTGKESEEAKAFIEWVKTSEEAAKIIKKVGFMAVARG